MRARSYRDVLLLGDCRTILRQLPAGVADLCVTDPPYNIASAHALTRNNGRVISTAEAWGAWDTFSEADYLKLLTDVFIGLRHALRQGGQLYIWLGTRYLSDAIRRAEAAGFRYRAKIVAVKARPQPQWRRSNWGSAYEECLYLTLGAPRPFHFTSQRDMRNALLLPFEPKATDHPTEKRPAMLAPLIRASSNRGELVLDPFLGSGTTAAVARNLGRHYLGIERDPDYYQMALGRLAAAA